ncbi:Oxysterol-binding protein-domain-containing protein [Mucor mucedo]|uniref:Oxysterol-binding protein-domain-containing protein n=1 Tax=Mucor mucedo TaxID=29922 RepID=UPI0022206549|nr:Oxysterol-binding protein-domain-containing protein [Mucor mucedo]KAI7896682.1 Oxysterol-binding protein-domain-containing protein [Mucor mucedo]
MSGWLLKKRRKKLQGWAKRWFQLSKTGILSYSENPESVRCGSIQVLLATISLNPSQRLIHIDSGSSLFHLRCATDKEFEDWTTALKGFRDREYPQLLEQIKIETTNNKNVIEKEDVNVIWTQIDKGIHNADLITQRLELLKSKADAYIQETDDQAFSNEADAVLSIARDQKSLWNDIQNSVKQYLAVDISNRVPMIDRHNSKIKIDENNFLSVADNLSPDPNYEQLPYRKSIASEKFYDAESIILSSDDEDYGDNENVEDSDDNTENEDDANDNKTSQQKPMKESNIVTLMSKPYNFHRRQILPAPAASSGVSALSIFRKNIGKDLSQIALPVSMNEPLSMLEKACEELEYSELLDRASEKTDSLDRLMYVTAFAISAYASSQWRTDRKPFNPILTETYECIRPDKGFRFISEKVSHHPLIIASHAESHAYKYWQCTKLKSKFWGKSMEFIAEGTFHVHLNDKEHYTFTKPSSWMRNMIAGDKYLEHVGEMKVVNQTSGEHAIVTFKEGTGGGIFSAPKERNNVTALLYTADGERQKRMVGKWSEALAEDIDMEGRTLSVIWKATMPTNPDFTKKYYGFSQFAIELNEITPIEKGKLPKTDSRLRPDQRLYEEGKVEEADNEKSRIEKKQRETRALLAEQGVSWSPQWFILQDTANMQDSDQDLKDNEGVSQVWQFAGQYWNVRGTGHWPENTPDLW